MIRYCYGSLAVVFLLFPMLIFAEEPLPEKEVEMKHTGDKSNLHRGAISRKFGEISINNSEGKREKWDLTHAKELVLWCNGLEYGQSPRVIKGLLSVGSPANKFFYYRGGGCRCGNSGA
jgi:hypothetical protein